MGQTSQLGRPRFPALGRVACLGYCQSISVRAETTDVALLLAGYNSVCYRIREFRTHTEERPPQAARRHNHKQARCTSSSLMIVELPGSHYTLATGGHSARRQPPGGAQVSYTRRSVPQASRSRSTTFICKHVGVDGNRAPRYPNDPVFFERRRRSIRFFGWRHSVMCAECRRHLSGSVACRTRPREGSIDRFAPTSAEFQPFVTLLSELLVQRAGSLCITGPDLS